MIDRFWQTRMTGDATSGQRAAVSTDAKEPASRSVPSEIIEMGDKASAGKERIASAVEPATNDAKAGSRATTQTAPAVSKRSLWGIRIGSEATQAKPSEVEIRTAPATPTETQRSDGAHAAKIPARSVTDRDIPRAPGGGEKVHARSESAATTSGREQRLFDAPVFSRTSETRRSVAAPEAASGDSVEAKPTVIRKQEEVLLNQSAAARETVRIARDSHSEDGKRVPQAGSETSRATAASERNRSAQSTAVRSESSPLLTPENRANGTVEAPRSVPVEKQGETRVQSDAPSRSAKSASLGEPPAKSPAIRAKANTDHTNASGTRPSAVVNPKEMTRSAEFAATTHHDAKRGVRSAVFRVSERPQSAPKAASSSPSSPVSVSENRSNRTAAAEKTTPKPRMIPMTSPAAAEPRATQPGASARATHETPRNARAGAAPTQGAEITNRPGEPELRATAASRNPREAAVMPSGDDKPSGGKASPRSDHSTASFGQSHEIIASHAKSATFVRKARADSMSGEFKTLAAKTRTVKEAIAPNDARPRAASRSALKTVNAEPRTATRPLFSPDKPATETPRSAVNDTETPTLKTVNAEPRTATRPLFSPDKPATETPRSAVNDAETPALKTVNAEPRTATKALFSPDKIATETPRSAVNDAETPALKTVNAEPRAATKPTAPASARAAETGRSEVQDGAPYAAKTPVTTPHKAARSVVSSSSAGVPTSPEKTQQAPHQPAGDRPAASGQIAQTETRTAATAIPLATAPHRPRLSAEQVREIQTMVARSVANTRTTVFGESSARFSMQHATLGALQFRITTRQDDVAIEISSPHRETTEALEEGRPAVERAIADLGLRVERFEIRQRDVNALQDPMNRGLDSERQPTRDHAASSAEEAWADGGFDSGESENPVEGQPLLAEHEWVA
ncbi:MAG: flagellar hook-length control protein FliK [bacterium]|nr:flagellar hook-length control protein FliK [bacterium]